MTTQALYRRQATLPAGRSSKKATRQMTLCRGRAARTGRHNEYYPGICLQGKWLWDCGFRSGHVVDITCEDRKLIITLAKAQRFHLD